MSPYCAFPGARCQKLATRSVVIPGVGPRLLCEPHFFWGENRGLPMQRVTEIRRPQPQGAA